ncbi:MAG: hypothetical protein AB8H80_12925 [Planctomycetota bacterium]
MAAQCQTVWELDQLAAFGVVGEVLAAERWDPDGSGPLPEVLVVGGAISQAGAVAVQGLAFYEPTTATWIRPPASPNGIVRDVLVTAAGDLVVAGAFVSVGGIPGTTGIARWSGSSWTTLGGGVAGSVSSVAEMANGDLLVGGRFATVGSMAITANNVARFDGAQWHAFGPGLSYAADPSRENVTDVAQLPNGEPIAMGAIDQSGTTPVANVVSWDGSNWVSRSPGPFFAPRSLLVLANGEVWLNGFDLVAANPYRWSNGAWVSVPNVPAGLTAIGELASGDLVGAAPPAAFGAPSQVYRFRAGVWAAIGAGAGARVAVVAQLPGANPDDFVMGGMIGTMGPVGGAGGVRFDNLASYVGGAWSPLGAPSAAPTGRVLAIAKGADGSLYAAGQFTQIGGVAASNVARWDGQSWQALGSGANLTVSDIAVSGSGDVYCSGTFTSIGGVAANRLARWDGSNWFAVPGTTGVIYALHELLDGSILVGATGLFVISPQGSVSMVPDTSFVTDVVELADGRIAAIGSPQTWGGSGTTRGAIWDGAGWTLMTYAFGTPGSLAVGPDGHPVVAANFFSGGAIQSWDGTGWTTLLDSPNVVPRVMRRAPNGDLLAGPVRLPGMVATTALARFDGTTWLPVADVGGNVADLLPNTDGAVDVATGPASIFAGGTSRIRRLASTCRAAAVSVPSGCAANAATLRVVRGSFVGATCESYGSDLPPNGIVVDAYGLQPSNLVLGTLLPNAIAGCRLLLDPAFTSVRPIQAGTVRTQLAIPDVAALVGLRLYQQLVPFAFGPLGNVQDVRTSNALDFTIGAF